MDSRVEYFDDGAVDIDRVGNEHLAREHAANGVGDGALAVAGSAVERVGRGGSKPGEETGDSALGEGAPNAQEEDRPGRGGDRKAQDESPEQKAEHRTHPWRAIV